MNTIVWPESDGFLLEEIDTETPESIVTDEEAEAMLVPELSRIFSVKLADPVPEGVHVGLLAEVDENEPDAPLSLHE